MTDNSKGCVIIGGYEIKYMINEGAAAVTEVKGNGSRLVIPDSFEDAAVTTASKKSFFACKSLRDVSLPGTVTLVDDWAFAGCENLKNFIIRDGGNPSFGSRVFDKCVKMNNICLGYEEYDDMSHLLGAVIFRMPAEYLLKDNDIGDDTWFEKWDRCLLTYLNEPDEDGYTDLVLCGEEDIFYNEPDYASNKRKKKSSLCMLRLLHKKNLGADAAEKYAGYLKSHTKGCDTEEAWQVLLEEYGNKTDYYKLFYDTGCITKDNIDMMIGSMGGSHAEAKAYMLSLKREKFSEEDIFASLEL